MSGDAGGSVALSTVYSSSFSPGALESAEAAMTVTLEIWVRVVLRVEARWRCGGASCPGGWK